MLTLISPGADFSASSDYALPVASGCEYFNFFRQESDLTRNLAPGKAAGSVVGVPSMGTGFVTCSGGVAFIQTAVEQTTTMTLMVVARARNWGAAPLQAFISNWNSGAGAAGLLLNVQVTAKLRGFLPTDNAGTPVSLIAEVDSDAETDWVFAAMTLNATSGVAIRTWDLTNDESTSASNAYTAPVNASEFRIGSAYPLGYNGQCDIAFGAMYSRVTTDAEIRKVYAAAKYVAGLDGITI